MTIDANARFGMERYFGGDVQRRIVILAALLIVTACAKDQLFVQSQSLVPLDDEGLNRLHVATYDHSLSEEQRIKARREMLERMKDPEFEARVAKRFGEDREQLRLYREWLNSRPNPPLIPTGVGKVLTEGPLQSRVSRVTSKLNDACVFSSTWSDLPEAYFSVRPEHSSYVISIQPVQSTVEEMFHRISLSIGGDLPVFNFNQNRLFRCVKVSGMGWQEGYSSASGGVYCLFANSVFDIWPGAAASQTQSIHIGDGRCLSFPGGGGPSGGGEGGDDDDEDEDEDEGSCYTIHYDAANDKWVIIEIIC